MWNGVPRRACNRIVFTVAVAIAISSVPALAQFSTISRGPLSGFCNGPALGLDIVNNNGYSCGISLPGAPAQWKIMGSGGGSGTVNAGLTNQLGYYPSNGTAISGKSWADLSILNYAVGGGAAQAQTVTLANPATTLAAGLEVWWLPIAGNTGPGATLAVNGLTAEPITKFGVSALAAGDLTTTAYAHAKFDGSNFQLQNPQTSTSGSGCIANPADGGCALAGSPSVDLFIGSVGGGTGWLFQLLATALNIKVPVNIGNGGGVAGAYSLACGTNPGLGSGIAWIGPPTCTPYNIAPPQTPGSGYWQVSAVGNQVTSAIEQNINLASSNDVGNSILGVLNGGTGNSTASGALVNLFPTPTRVGDWILWNGSAWNNCSGNTGATGFLVEGSGGSCGYVQVPIPPGDGGTGLTTLSLNTVYKGNNGSAMTATTIVESSITNQVSIGDPLLENHYQSNSPTSPTCVFTTGGGTTPSCAAAAGSSDSGGLINLTAGTGSPGSSGTITITLNSALGVHGAACTVAASQQLTGFWNARATIMFGSGSTTSWTFKFDNNSVALTTSTAYQVAYHCYGI
jgi:hypothetical protein